MSGFKRLGDEGLQDVAFDRELLDAGLAHHLRGVAGDRDADLRRADRAAARDDADDAVALLQEPGHLAILDDVDAEPVGGMGEAPGDGVVARRAAARLEQPADDGKARVMGKVEAGAELGDFLRLQKLRVDAVQPHAVAALGELVELGRRVGEVQDAALREHDIVVERLAEPLPELQAPLVELLVLVEQVVGADDRGVAPDIPLADPAALHHRDVADAVHLGEVEGGGEPMPAAADDDHVVGGLRLGLAPGRPPALVAGQTMAQHGEDGIFGHVSHAGQTAIGPGAAFRVNDLCRAISPSGFMARARPAAAPDATADAALSPVPGENAKGSS